MQCLAHFLPDSYFLFTPKTNKAFLLLGVPVFNKQMPKSIEWIFDIFEVYSKIVRN